MTNLTKKSKWWEVFGEFYSQNDIIHEFKFFIFSSIKWSRWTKESYIKETNEWDVNKFMVVIEHVSEGYYVTQLPSTQGNLQEIK